MPALLERDAQRAELADRCGATSLAERAREELHAAGARPRRERLSGASPGWPPAE